MSSPTRTPNSKATAGLTPRDIELLSIGIQSMKDPNVSIDYDKFAELAGLTAGSARVIWGKLRRKVNATSRVDGTPASAASQAAKPKAKKGARKRKSENAENTGGVALGEPQSPSAIAAERRKKRVKKSPRADPPAQESEEGVHVKAEDGAIIKTEQ